MEKIEDVLAYNTPSEIRQTHPRIKKTVTQIKNICLENKKLLTEKDLKTLQKSEEILEKLLRKRSAYAKKLENDNEKEEREIEKNLKTLRLLFKDLSDVEKLAYILVMNLNAFMWRITFEEAFEEFLTTFAKQILKTTT